MDNTGTSLSGTNEEERGTVRNETGEQGNSDQSGTSQEHEKEENVDEEDEDLFAAYEIDHPVSQPGNEETEAANASEHIQLEGSQDEQEVQKKEEDSSSVKPDLPPRDTTTDVPVSTGKPDLPPRDVTNMPRSEEASEVDAEKDDQYTANTSVESEHPSVIVNTRGNNNAGVPKTPTWFDFEHAGTDMYTSTLDSLSSPVNMNMAYTRFQENEDKLLQKEPVERDDIMHSRDSLKKTFNEIKTGVSITQNEQLINQIDWEFWSEVFNDYSSIVKNKQSELRKNITKGIPMELRGMAWQIICDSNSMRLKEFFINTRNSRSDFEKLIRRDLARTRFIKDAQIRDKIEELFSIIKTYSLYDHEVGYTQGMAFITVPLLMNMEPDAAFCMLVRLMFTYGFRELYLPEMPGLHLRIYQFDRLMEDTLPELYNHLENQNIKSSMYAIQWFMTLFAYKFPLDMVLRIYDVVVAEGLESILKFALNLMMKNEQHLLTLKFDSLLDFLKEKIFYYYQETPNPNEETANEATYQIDKFISDAMEINILPLTLQRYTTEFDEIDKLEKLREEQAKDLQSQNGLLTKEIRKIEALYAVLNKEHVEIANEMIQGKIKIGSLEEENQFLKEQIEQLETRLANLKANSDTKVDFTTSTKEIGTGLDEEIQSAMEKNLEVMDQNRILEDQLAELEEENRQLKEAKTKVSSVFGGLKKGKFW
ncbi:GTPase-activating protein GYP5 [Pichia kudriavzevii]|uniref:GTPase-activating protein GYP5 n=1 Tax=Pichia kudriavzevii TaxID=4909 RepID=A0A1V2LIP8_PICKU|nr:GTPase-activating protein GYP5 [Pichia kudriavzevii]